MAPPRPCNWASMSEETFKRLRHEYDSHYGKAIWKSKNDALAAREEAQSRLNFNNAVIGQAFAKACQIVELEPDVLSYAPDTSGEEHSQEEGAKSGDATGGTFISANSDVTGKRAPNISYEELLVKSQPFAWGLGHFEDSSGIANMTDTDDVFLDADGDGKLEFNLPREAPGKESSREDCHSCDKPGERFLQTGTSEGTNPKRPQSEEDRSIKETPRENAGPEITVPKTKTSCDGSDYGGSVSDTSSVAPVVPTALQHQRTRIYSESLQRDRENPFEEKPSDCKKPRNNYSRSKDVMTVSPANTPVKDTSWYEPSQVDRGSHCISLIKDDIRDESSFVVETGFGIGGITPMATTDEISRNEGNPLKSDNASAQHAMREDELVGGTAASSSAGLGKEGESIRSLNQRIDIRDGTPTATSPKLGNAFAAVKSRPSPPTRGIDPYMKQPDFKYNVLLSLELVHPALRNEIKLPSGMQWRSGSHVTPALNVNPSLSRTASDLPNPSSEGSAYPTVQKVSDDVAENDQSFNNPSSSTTNRQNGVKEAQGSERPEIEEPSQTTGNAGFCEEQVTRTSIMGQLASPASPSTVGNTASQNANRDENGSLSQRNSMSREEKIREILLDRTKNFKPKQLGERRGQVVPRLILGDMSKPKQQRTSNDTTPAATPTRPGKTKPNTSKMMMSADDSKFSVKAGPNDSAMSLGSPRNSRFAHQSLASVSSSAVERDKMLHELAAWLFELEKTVNKYAAAAEYWKKRLEETEESIKDLELGLTRHREKWMIATLLEDGAVEATGGGKTDQVAGSSGGKSRRKDHAGGDSNRLFGRRRSVTSPIADTDNDWETIRSRLSRFV